MSDIRESGTVSGFVQKGEDLNKREKMPTEEQKTQVNVPVKVNEEKLRAAEEIRRGNKEVAKEAEKEEKTIDEENEEIF